MTHEHYVINGDHFYVLPIEDAAIEAFAQSLAMRTIMDDASILHLLEQPGMKDAIIEAARSYTTHPSRNPVAQPIPQKVDTPPQHQEQDTGMAHELEGMARNGESSRHRDIERQST
jgi:hypothetical protein